MTRDPDEGWVNCGTYRVMVHNEKQVGYYISPGQARAHPSAEVLRSRRTLPRGHGDRLPSADVLRVMHGDPIRVQRVRLGGGHQREAAQGHYGASTGLPFPADAEIVLEGFAIP